ncbi:hypothetical protein BT93_I1296 [Corymbia citriodora subsp. variegata]|nr:hypothetical protein BT93_I1296 [Corymbia citriodora subsp. variegata]
MISTKKLIQMARKWQKGHFVVYTADNRRFVISLLYLGNDIIRELFRISEEEFGIPNSGPIRLPIDASSMEYIISLISRGLAKDLENALLMSITSCSSSCIALDKRFSCPQLYVCSC